MRSRVFVLKVAALFGRDKESSENRIARDARKFQPAGFTRLSPMNPIPSVSNLQIFLMMDIIFSFRNQSRGRRSSRMLPRRASHGMN